MGERRFTARQRALLRETLEDMQINGEPDATLDDAIERSMGECGQLPDGTCTQAGSEYCDWECPWS